MNTLEIKPAHKSIRAYYDSLAEFEKHGYSKETSVRDAFADLLKFCARKFGTEGKWTLIPEYTWRLANGNSGAIDGAIVTDLGIVVGYWEAKDLGDDLKKEVQKKFKAGYPQSNILFQTPERAILYRDKTEIGEYDLKKPEALVKCLQDFFGGRAETEIQWEQAVQNFKERIHDFGSQLEQMIEKERKENPTFAETFRGFAELCRASINPNLSDSAVEEMLIQHLLTRRIFESVLANRDFMLRNPIGLEIEKVVAALTGRNFNPQDFFKPLEHYYTQLEAKARTITEWSEKQQFLNTVYEKFFQGFSVKVADTHGIVYTPQPIVDFMVKSVQHILKTEFNRSLAAENVHILDPFVGTGSFMMRVIREIGATQKSRLPQKYKNELHCNEVMLLPYYIASMNIEHEYYQQTGSYQPFDGICLVDTFELAEPHQTSLFTTENTERVERQKRSPIFVIIGNPPYNLGQVNENDNNKNRRYPVVDLRVSETYAKDSTAQLKNKLSDPYVKAIRWASDRVGKDGVVAFVSNNSFIEKNSFDGVRKHLVKDFSSIWCLDLQGDVRKDSMRDGIPIGEANTVFGLSAMVGVAVTLFVRNSAAKGCTVHYHTVDWRAKRSEKFQLMQDSCDVSGIEWQVIVPGKNSIWLSEGMSTEFGAFPPIVVRNADASQPEQGIFEQRSLGVVTSRDDWVWSFNRNDVAEKAARMIQNYNTEVGRSMQWRGHRDLDAQLTQDASYVKWTDRLKDALKQGVTLTFDEEKIRSSQYRPFTNGFLYFDQLLNQRQYQLRKLYPNSVAENFGICISDRGMRAPFSVIMVNRIPDVHLCASSDLFQCFPFYTYSEDGTNRKENITDWALEQFKSRVPGSAASRAGKRGSSASTHTELSKWDIFYYVYGLLHHPGYRTKYAANLRRELPRIPLPKDAAMFWNLSDAGKKLADLHVNYESAAEYDLKEDWHGEGLDLRVEKMKLTKDKTGIIYNSHLTLTGIPPEAFEYRLGNRSAIDWIINQYQVSTDKRSGITNDPNRSEAPDYILRLIKRVATVSMKTVKIVREIAPLEI